MKVAMAVTDESFFNTLYKKIMVASGIGRKEDCFFNGFD
jgi:hypothetical protein